MRRRVSIRMETRCYRMCNFFLVDGGVIFFSVINENRIIKLVL